MKGTPEQVNNVIELHRKQRNIPYSATTLPKDPMGSMANGINRIVDSAFALHRMYMYDVVWGDKVCGAV